METLFLILYKLCFFIINVDAVLLIFLLLGTILLSTRWWQKGQRLLSVVSILLVFLIVIPTSEWMGVCLENRFPKLKEIPSDATGIILLGGNFDLQVTRARQETSYNPAAGRLMAFMELARAYPHLKLIFSGGGPRPAGTPSEAEITKQVLQKIGIEVNRIQFEGESKNTLENAHLSFQKFKPQPHEKWVLVTSAFHMPRAVGLFRKAGWTVIPYPVDYHTTGVYTKSPNFSLFKGFFLWRYASMEWIGMLSAYLQGHSHELFPGPQ